MHRSCRFIRVAGALLALGLLTPEAAAAKMTFKRLSTVNASAGPTAPITRTPNGTLHLLYQTFAGRHFSGLASMSISKSGTPGPEVQALAGWEAGQPGLVAFPNGTLEGMFGAISPSNTDGVWGITSANGGATWSAPALVGARGPDEALAYGADVTAAMSAGTPVLSLPQAGNLIIQRGLGPGSPVYQVNNASDGAVGEPELATDAVTGEVVAGWQSIAHKVTLYLQGVAPKLGAVQAMPGQSRNSVVLAGRDKGAGVFGAYSSDGTHVRLLRYGGGSIAVGKLPGVTAKTLGVATGLDGRIWVMWGDENGGLAVTRSNKAVTRFEPLQHLDPNAFSLYRLSGDGRLGPLDLLVDEIPNVKNAPPPGNYYARVLPELSATASVKPIKNKKGKIIGFTLKIKVTDAGDAISGATVSAAGKKSKTNNSGIATITVPGSGPGKVTVTISAPGYQPLLVKVQL